MTTSITNRRRSFNTAERINFSAKRNSKKNRLGTEFLLENDLSVNKYQVNPVVEKTQVISDAIPFLR